jgi:hypothetical protein
MTGPYYLIKPNPYPHHPYSLALLSNSMAPSKAFMYQSPILKTKSSLQHNELSSYSLWNLEQG